MPEPPDGVRLGVRIAFGGGGAGLSGASFAGLTLAPIPRARTGPEAWMVPEDGRNALATLGIAAVGTIGTGMLVRALRPGGQRVADPREIILDGLVGVQLGSGLIGTPEAEAFFAGGAFSLPLQWFNRRKDPSWDFRVGMLSQGVVALGREALGGDVIPFQGWRWNDDGTAHLHTMELLGNAGTDIALDAATYGLGNSLAAAVQGKAGDGEIWGWAKRGAIYGTVQSAVTNAALGPPIRLDPATRAEAARLAASGPGPDVSDVADHTTFRSGGLILAFGMNGITLGRNVVLEPEGIGRPSLIHHELIHRDQIAGRPGNGPGAREGHGLASFYTQYLVDARRYGYTGIPYEQEAYHYANGATWPQPLTGEVSLHGDLLGHALGQSLFAGASLFMRKKDDSSVVPSAPEAPSGSDESGKTDAPAPESAEAPTAEARKGGLP